MLAAMMDWMGGSDFILDLVTGVVIRGLSELGDDWRQQSLGSGPDSRIHTCSMINIP